MKERDDFSKRTVLQLAERAAYRCSRPECRANTIMPSSSSETDSVKTGRAAHIHGAAPGGPRYLSSQTKEQRSAFTNGIWLCAQCADLVDKDVVTFPHELLRSWKEQHDSWLRAGDFVPGLPELRITTQDGLYAHGSSVVSSEDLTRFRDHVVVLKTTTRHQLQDVRLRFQIPECLHDLKILEKASGEVNFRAEGNEWVVSGQGNDFFALPPPRPPRSFVIEIERLIPDRPIRMVLRTAPKMTRHGLSEDEDPVFAGQLLFHVTGSFLYEFNLEFSKREFLIPLREKGRNLIAATSEPRLDQPVVITISML